MMRANDATSHRTAGHSDMVLVSPCMMMTTGCQGLRSGPETETKSLCDPMETKARCSSLFQSMSSWPALASTPKSCYSESGQQKRDRQDTGGGEELAQIDSQVLPLLRSRRTWLLLRKIVDRKSDDCSTDKSCVLLIA